MISDISSRLIRELRAVSFTRINSCVAVREQVGSTVKRLHRNGAIENIGAGRASPPYYRSPPEFFRESTTEFLVSNATGPPISCGHEGEVELEPQRGNYRARILHCMFHCLTASIARTLDIRSLMYIREEINGGTKGAANC
jgi:hypothetical protein